MSDDEALHFLAVLIRQLGEDDFSFCAGDPAGGPQWQVYYVLHARQPYTLALRIAGDGAEEHVQVGLFESGTLSLQEVRRTLALHAPN